MLSNISRLKHTINNKDYVLICDSDSPLADLKESLFQFLKLAGQIEDSVRIQEAMKKKEEKLPEVPNEQPAAS